MAINKVVYDGDTLIDLTNDTATASDVASGKTFHLADGTIATGTASGGGGAATIEALTVTANGTYTAPSGVDGYSPVTVNVEGGGASASQSDVNFIDYDGTILYSYTASEAQSLTELPANPSHSGLTAQGWNWTLAQIKAQLTAMPDAPVWVGQMYVTSDDKTRIYCRFEDGRLAPYLGLCPKGTVSVDWGDGSSTDTLTGTSLTSAKTVQHTYASAGDYVITLTAASGTTFAFCGVKNAAWILTKAGGTAAYVNRVYAAAVRKIELGSAARIGNYAFNYCYNLESISIHSACTIGTYAFQYCYGLTHVTIPSGLTSISNYAFNGCYALASITIPSGVTSIGANAFEYCCALASITIPSGVTSIGTYVFRNCHSLASITIPSGVTSIGTYAFNNCYGLGGIHFLPTTPPTCSNSNAWTSIPADCIIYVPSGTLSAYTSATNYPSSSTYTYSEE